MDGAYKYLEDTDLYITPNILYFYIAVSGSWEILSNIGEFMVDFTWW